MVKDKRYDTVKKLIKGGHIKSFSEVLENIPKTNVARDLKMHHQTFEKLINFPEKFALEDAIKIASLIEVDDMVVIELIYNQYVKERKPKRKK
jgi:plasmid maintenance system antidote protein VapI